MRNKDVKHRICSNQLGEKALLYENSACQKGEGKRGVVFNNREPCVRLCVSEGGYH